jgi:threonine synthase
MLQRRLNMNMESYVTELKCARCGRRYKPDSGAIRCENRDDGRLDVFYDYEALKDALTKEQLSKRGKGVWKYRELLPLHNTNNVITLEEGGTPLVRSRNLAKQLGAINLWLLDDTRNPTSSFKDRPMTVGISKAVELGYDTVVSASSGNAAASLAAYSSKAGLKCITFVPDSASIGKLAQLSMYGAKVLKVRGDDPTQDPTVKMLKAVCDQYRWYPCPSFGPLNAYQAEGPKTMSYEIAEGLGWETPDWVLMGVGAGGGLGGNWKGYRDFQALDFINRVPRMVAVQSTGCAPLVRAYDQGSDPLRIAPWDNPESVATGLMDPFPWDGDLALRAVRESHGTAVAVSNEEILDAQWLLARTEGIFAEPSGAASLAGLIKLINTGIIDRSDTVAVEITGGGLKDPEVVKRAMPQIPEIGATIDELLQVMKL